MARPDPTLIDRRDYLRLSAGVAVGASAGLAGCSSSVPGTGDGTDGSGSGEDGSSATGLLSTAVSDQPGDIGDFESCIVTLDGIWVGPEVGGEGSEDEDGGDENETDAEDADEETEDDGEGQSSSDEDASGSQDDTSSTENSTDQDGTADADEGEDEEDADDADAEDDADEEEAGDGEDDGESEDDGSGRRYYEFEESQEADLTQLQGDAQQLVGEHELSVGTYQYLQLDISGIRGTLTDGSEAEVDTPGNAPLKFNESFDVREGYRTTFLADFTPVRRGNGSYIFQPVASETEVSYEQIDSGSGDGSNGGNTTDGDGNTTDTDGSVDDGGANSTETTGDSGNESQ